MSITRSKMEQVVVPTPYSKIFALKTSRWCGIYHLFIADPGRFKAWCETPVYALHLSIHKWAFIVMCYFGLDDCVFIFDESLHTCGLCELFIKDDCVNCPVQEESRNATHCSLTPYAEYANLTSIVEGEPDDRISRQQLQNQGKHAAINELNYLTGLASDQQYNEYDHNGHVLSLEV